MLRILSISLAFLSLPSIIGCGGGGENSAGNSSTAQQDSDDSDHGHHHHDLGPHGGHMLHLEPSGVHAEWTHDDESYLVSVFLDDFEADKIQAVKFVTKIGDESEEYPLESTENGWTISSEALLTNINMGEAVDVSLVVVDDAGEQTCTIDEHGHHHH